MSLNSVTHSDSDIKNSNLIFDWLSNAQNAMYDDWEAVIKYQIEQQSTGKVLLLKTNNIKIKLFVLQQNNRNWEYKLTKPQ